ncbi:MAG TPA: YsnF/AvaK domain-containing protein, partial [Verrucomicrobiae bacterium]|nr:YsnF/AvaK domain-containing protein [Verrucomicrobiae bacterium]
NLNETAADWDAVRVPTSKAAALSPQSPKPANTITTEKEEVLQLAEEHLDVAKRQVETGKARIRRFVIEEPVESRVTLHEEHAAMLRRPVTNGGTIKDVDWTDKTIEITETAERAVISKIARIVEEVVVRRQGSDHVETVRDKVRRQQVEIEHLPQGQQKVK